MAIVNDKIQDVYGLTPLQEGMLYHNLSDDDSTAYVTQTVFRFNKNINTNMFKEALYLLSRRYDALRTMFVYEKLKEPKQIVLKDRKLECSIIDLSDDDELVKKYKIERLLNDDVNRNFDLKKDSLLRATVLLLNSESSIIVLTIHHIIMDGWCDNIVFSKLFEYYFRLENGESIIMLKNEIDEEISRGSLFSDYIKWLNRQDKEKAKKYWEIELDGYENNIEIDPLNKPELNTEEQVRELIGELDKDKTEKLKKFADSIETTINTVAEVAVGILLQKYSRSNDVVFGKVVSGRNAPINGIEEIVGLFINTIPVRITTDKDMTITELIKKQQIKDIESTSYDYYSLAEIQNNTVLKSELIKQTFVFENHASGLNTEANEEKEDNEQLIIMESSREQTHYGISFAAMEIDDKLCFNILYNPNQYCDEEVKLIVDKLIKICEQIVVNPNGKVSEIEFVNEEEKIIVLEKFNDTEKIYSSDKTIVDIFEEQVVKTPEKDAVVFEDSKLTYRELNEKANAIAQKLRETGIKQDDFVAIISDRSLEMIEAIFGVIKSGGAYVPIDPTYPEERIKFMLEDSNPKAILVYTNEKINIINDIEISVIDLADGEVFKAVPKSLEKVNKPEDLIYCIYTSGTTGKPKGVMIEHRGVVNLAEFYINEHQVGIDDNVMMFANYVFDASITEIMTGLLSGATLHVISSDLRGSISGIEEYIENYKISIALLPPMFLEQLNLKGPRVIITAGSESNVRLVEKYKDIEVYSNDYGPTEGAVCATFWEHKKGEVIPEKVPIGKPISNKQVYILQGENLCGIGVPGELCIAGVGIARGYLNREELTAEKFVKNPYGEGRLYHTGDLARWLPDGNIEYLGRIDEQVKIRGFRVELGEIESRIKEIESIKDAAVIAKDDINGEKSIYAYFVSDENVISFSKIRETLLVNLPDYMIPSYMMQIESIPVTKNGKLDRRALPEIEAKTEKKYIAARNELEEKICNAFSEILGVEKVGIKDGFFELGGHSLRATRLVNRIEEQTGKRIALKDVFSNQSPEKLALLVNGENEEEYVSIPKAEKKDYYSMSSTQKRTYLICQMDPNRIVYNISQNYKLMGKVRPDAFREALQKLTDRHEILRTSFIIVDGEPMQKILSHVDADFEYIENSDESDEELIESFVKPFDLSNPPLVRVRLVNRGDYHLLSIDMHHIISDGMSSAIFIRELNALYNGEELVPLTHQFKDYSEWMRSRDLSSQAEYWKSQFDDEIPVLDMPLDFVRPQNHSYEGNTLVREIGNELSAKIKKLATESGATDYMVFMSAAMILLSKYSRQEDIVIGTPISGRTHRDTEGMLGMFINTLAMRGKPEANKTYMEFLNEIKETSLKAYENQEYPFEELVEAVDVTRDMSRSPLFDVMLILQNNEEEEINLGDIDTEWIDAKDSVSKFDLTFNIVEYNGEYGVLLEYCSALFNEESIRLLADHFVTLLGNIMVGVDKRLKDIEIVSDCEKRNLLNDFNDVKLSYLKEKTIVELFEEQVEKTPDKVAVVCKDKKLTYRELNEKANILACKLRNIGVKPNDFVAILTEKSLEMVIAMCGVVKSGGAYIPINVTYPEERIKYIIEDSKSKVLITYEAELPTILNEITVINLENDDVWEEKLVELDHVNRSTDIIYAIYTSGTTGQPKGVMIEHKSLNNHLLTVKNNIFNVEGDIPLFTNYAFDLTVSPIWGSLLSGKKLVVCREDEDLLEYATKNQIAVIKAVPTHFMLLLEASKEFGRPQINRVLLGGEVVTDMLIKKIYEVVGDNVEIINEYGPTECTIACSYTFLDKHEKITIGKPFYNCQLYIVNHGKLCGIGVPGELCVAGDCVARGYLNKEKMTDEKFEDNPFGDGKMYHTGDLARWLPDGNVDYLGRMDEQVKIRGFRIELGEIEGQIRKLEKVKDAAVIAKEDNSGEKSIYAYYVANEDKEILVSDLRESLSSVLPDYMIPTYMMQIESIPITRNGKLDKKALPNIEATSEREYVAPRNSVEKDLAKIFEDILGVEKVGIYDDFFSLGGNSIKSMRMVAQIRRLNYNISIKELYMKKTIHKIAKFIINCSESMDSLTDNEIFMLDPYKDILPEGMNDEILEVITAYKKNIVDKSIVNTFNPNVGQIEYIVNSYEENNNLLCDFKVKGVSYKQLNEAILGIVKMQSVLRTGYCENTKKFVEYDFDKWSIPVLETINYKREDIIKGLSSYKSVSGDDILPVILLLQNEDDYEVFVSANHALWDNMSKNIMFDLLCETLRDNNVKKNNKQTYTEYVLSKSEANNNLYSDEEKKQILDCINIYDDIMLERSSGYEGVNFGFPRDDKTTYNIQWCLNKYLDIQNMKNIKELPILVLYHGRYSENSLSTLGMYIELIPGIYDCEKNKVLFVDAVIDKLKENEIGYKFIIDEKSAEIFKNVIRINIYENIEMDGREELKEITYCEEESTFPSITLSLGKKMVALSMVFKSDDKSENRLIGKVKNIFGLE
ncbi:MAG TPA: amino acid adenylation domain-containing protein [Methanosphaera sp.]|nr:amino acid adenylation domain-containing protein [Methanosphaera sp.]